MSFYTFFPKLLNMSLTASVAIVFVLFLRLLLKKAPKSISYALWGIVLIRLLCPVSIESNFSLFGLMDAPAAARGEMTSAIEYVPNNIVHTPYPTVALPIPGVSNAINDALPQGEEQMAADPLEAPTTFATMIWLTGVSVMTVYAAVSYIGLRRRLITASPLRDNIYLADGITSPFVMGLFRPKIYLPSAMDEREQSYIILHEKHHIRRADHIVKALAFAALCIHWFNPLVWAAFIMAGKDMEMSCDEAVVKKMGEGVLAEYTASLLSLATGRHIIAGMPLAFGEGDTKGRIRNLANWKKPALWVILATVTACAVLGVCLLTNPAKPPFDPGALHIKWAKTLDMRPVEPLTFDLNDAELDELKSRLVDVKLGRKDNDLRGSTPFYSISIQTDGYYFSVQGFDADGKHIALYYGDDYYRIDDSEFGEYLSRICAGDDRESAAKRLSLEDVILLSEKGIDLTWDDFSGYESRTINSDKDILRYVIDEQYSLVIRGRPNEDPPVFIHLYHNFGAADASWIDIRKHDVSEFLASMQITVDVASSVDAPEAAISWGKQIVMRKLKEQNDLGRRLGYRAADAELTALELISTGTTGLTSGEVLYRLQYRIGFDHPEKIEMDEGMRMDGDRLTEWSVDGQPCLLLHWEDTGEKVIWKSVCEVYTDRIANEFGTPEMIEKYGDVYTAAVMELYRKSGGLYLNSDPLDAAIRTAVLDHNWSAEPDGLIHCESHVILREERGIPMVGGRTSAIRIYAMVLYQEYGFSGAAFHEANGSYYPTVLTFAESDNGEFTLEEYWQPDDSPLVPQIYEKFPGDIAEEVLDMQKYILALKQNCYAQAVEYGQVDTNYVVGQLLETICSSPSTSSSTHDHIEAHSSEYNELLNYGDYTLRYIFGEFLKGGQTDLRGEIMHSVMMRLIKPEGLYDSVYESAQKSFDEFREYNERLYERNDEAYMKENCPKGLILMEMIGK